MRTTRSILSFQGLRTLSLLMTFFTGFSGLVYEVTWHRYLANFIGSEARAAAIILAVFLGGLCLGYLFFGRFSLRRSASQLVRTCGWIEILIGVWAVCFPTIYRALWQTIGVLNPASQLALFWDLGICFALIGLPTVLMGGTLPLLTQGLSMDLEDSAPFHAKVYAVNTAGAFAGCVAGGFVLLPMYGLPLTIMAMGVVNLSAGLILIGCGSLLHSHTVAASTNVQIPTGSNSAVCGIGRASVVAFFAGFYALSLQTVFMRLVGLSMGSSEYSFAMIVAVFILMLALGAWRLAGTRGAVISLEINQSLIFLGIFVIYLLVPFWPYAAHVIRTFYSSAAPAFYVYHGSVFLILGVLLSLAVGPMGSTMPLLFSAVKARFEELGSYVGRLYAWNTLGCVFGALCGGHLLLYIFNLDGIFKICMSLMLVTIVLVSRRAQLLQRLLLAGVCIVGVWFLPDWDKTHFAKGTFRLRAAQEFSYAGARNFYREHFGGRQLIAYKDDPNTSVSVIQYSYVEPGKTTSTPFLSRSLYSNGKSDGATSGNDVRTTQLLAHLPALFQTSQSSRAAVIGYGTGITVGALGLHPEITEIQCTEIAPFIKEFAPFFDFANHNTSKLSKLQLTIGDAYRKFGSSTDQYALIISEPSNPWVTGVERVFTREFYLLLRDRLASGGIYSQWFQTYEISEETIGLVINTFASVFENVIIFRSGYDMILLGSQEPLGEEALRALAKRFEKKEVKEELSSMGIKSVEALLGFELTLPKELYSTLGYHTLEFPKLSYRAGKDFFFGLESPLEDIAASELKRPWVRLAADRSLLRRWVLQNGKSTAVLRAAVKGTCQVEEAKLFEKWRNADRSCQDALIALVLAGDALPGYGFSESDRMVVQELLDETSPYGIPRSLEPAYTTHDAIAAAQLFTRHDSPLLKLSPEKLHTKARVCFDSLSAETLTCRAYLVRAYSLTGHAEIAVRELNALSQVVKGGGELSTKALLDVTKLAKESIQAAKVVKQ